MYMKGKDIYKKVITLILIVILGVISFRYLSSYFGWYAYQKRKYRLSTNDINDSKKRGVFVKEVHFEIDSFPGNIENFRAYIEKGFHFGHESEDERFPLLNTNYSYQLIFNFPLSSKLGIFITETELKKFDSSSKLSGYLRLPKLKDTVTFYLVSEHGHVVDVSICACKSSAQNRMEIINNRQSFVA